MAATLAQITGRTLARSIGVLLIVLLGAVWEATVRAKLVDTPTLPALSEVLHAFWQLLVDGTFATVFLPSLERLFLGYFIACAAAILLGIAMGFNRWIFRLFNPLVEILRPIPSPAYVPMAILFLGIGNQMKVFMVAFASFFPILLNTISGVRNVDRVLIDTGRTFGLTRAQLIVKVVLPSASVYILTGMRISLAVALIVTVLAEMVTGNDGIGFFILNSQRSFHIAEMYAAVIALAVVGYALNQLFVFVESRLLAWNIGQRATEA
jgi:ABC-type nitrate/sulfonate/bicarbonate transport system permease component